MEKNAQPQGRVLRRAEHPSSMRTVAGTLTHVDATNKMTTGPSFDMAFLDNYLSSQSSDLNTPEIDLKAFNFGKDNVKSKLAVTRMEVSKMVASPQPTPENTAFFDMSISSPPAFGDEEQTSSANKFAELCNSEDLDNRLFATETAEEPIPKAPLLANSKPIEFMSFGNNSNPVTQPSEMPFDIPHEFFNDDYLFPDAELGLEEDDQLINSLKLDLGMYLPNQEKKDDILSQAVAELPSPEQLNNMLETPGMMPPTFVQQQPSHLAPVELFPDLLASSLLSHDSMQSNSAPQELIIPVQSNSAQQEIVIPNFFHNNTEYQTVTYQVQDFTSNTFQQVQNNARNSVQHMDVDIKTSKFVHSDSSDSTLFDILPSPYTYSAPIIELPEESDIKPIVEMFNEAVPSTSSGKRRRTTQKPSRYRDSLEHPCDESQPSTSFVGEKKLKLTDEEKYHRIRIMNNEASRKCRQNRKQKNVNVEHEITEMENKQITLKAKEAELIKMRDKMKALYYEFMKRKMTPH